MTEARILLAPAAIVEYDGHNSAPASGSVLRALGLSPMLNVRRVPSFGSLPTTVRSVRASDDSDTAIAQTVAEMSAIVRAAVSDPLVLSAAGFAVEGLSVLASAREKAGAVFYWIKRNIRFLSDDETAVLRLGVPADQQDILIEPARLLSMDDPAGDCDDFAMLTAALLAAVGVASEFATVAANPRAPALFSHVYVIASLPHGDKLALDTSHGRYPGWAPAPVARLRTWPSMGGDTMRGLGRSASALDSQVLGGRRAGLGFDVSGAAAGGLEWWQSLIKTGVETTGSILKSRYGQPPPGTYIQRTATGEVVYRTDPQAGGFQTIPPLGAGGTNLLMWGGIALGGVLLISMLKGR